MRNKEWFLKELQSRIALLEDAEQQDILAEYAQHIDLRVDGGLTEEDAIRDFGDLDQLAAEILEAYHVKPAFGQKAPKPRPPFPDTVRKGCTKTGAWFRRAGSAVARFFRRLWLGMTNGFHKCGDKLKGLFRRKSPEGETPLPEKREEAPVPMTAAQEHRRPVRAALKRTCGTLGRFCKLLARLLWNLALLICAVPFACLGLGAILCLGLLAVLLVQGYPLAGIALCCIGAALFCAGILGLGSSLVWRRPVSAPIPPAAEAEEPSAPAFTQDPVTDLIRRTVQEEEEAHHE